MIVHCPAADARSSAAASEPSTFARPAAARPRASGACGLTARGVRRGTAAKNEGSREHGDQDQPVVWERTHDTRLQQPSSTIKPGLSQSSLRLSQSSSRHIRQDLKMMSTLRSAEQGVCSGYLLRIAKKPTVAAARAPQIRGTDEATVHAAEAAQIVASRAVVNRSSELRRNGLRRVDRKQLSPSRCPDEQGDEERREHDAKRCHRHHWSMATSGRASLESRFCWVFGSWCALVCRARTRSA